MTHRRPTLVLTALVVSALFVGCGPGGDSDGEGNSSTDGSSTASACAREDLNTFKDGVLTIATDEPAYPPYVIDDDPTNGKGFEGALGYAIAGQLGFNDSQVVWTRVPFEEVSKPGPKLFDLALNQVAITAGREKSVSFSAPYYAADQAVLVSQGGKLDGITGLEGLKDATIGVQAGTTSLDAVKEQIQPARDPRVFDDSDGVVAALEKGQVEAIVVDLPTALRLQGTELPKTVVAGQFGQEGGEQWGAVMTKDSELKSCVDQAIEGLESDGILEELTSWWMSTEAEVPILE